MSGCEIIKCKWWRGTSQSCAEPSSVCIYQQQDAAIAALKAENERLAAEKQQKQLCIDDCKRQLSQMEQSIAAAEKRELELRKALQRLVSAVSNIRHELGTQYPELSESWTLAQSALGS